MSGEPQRVDPLTVDVQVVHGAGRTGQAVGPFAWGLGAGPTDAAAVDAALPAAPQDPTESPQQRDARLRAQFGSTVLIGADGRLTKQYFMADELGTTFLKLIEEIADEPLTSGRKVQPPKPGTKVGGDHARSVLGRMLQGHEVEVTYVPEFEGLGGVRLVDEGPNKPAVTGAPVAAGPGPSVALVLITASPASLAAFEAALDLFYTSIPQIEITVQVIEYQTSDALAFGVSAIDENTPLLSNLSSSQLVRQYTSVFPMRQPIVGSNPVTDIGLFTLGGIHDSWELNAVLEALEANNLADIQSAPKLVVRNGGLAAISTVTQIPFPKAKITQLGASVATDIDFKPVGVKMNIIPILAGTDSIILQIYADVSAVIGFADTDPVVTPITAQRTAVTTVYLKDDHTLVIGGLTSESKIENETKVPILGDIPLLGFFFRSTSTSRSKTNVEFLIRPRIVTDRGDVRTTPDGF